MSDPYVYEGTTVLRNTLDLREASALEIAERRFSASRMAEVQKVELTYAGYKRIHGYLFQDVYDWAGQPRTIDISKGNSLFGLAPYIDTNMERLFQGLADEKKLQGSSRNRFTERAAYYLGEINAVHPFREGNGRTQRAFLKGLAQQAGWKLDLERIEPGPWNEASIQSFKGDYEPLRSVIDEAVTGPVFMLNRGSKERGDGRER